MFHSDFNFTPENRIIYGIDGEPVVWIERECMDTNTEKRYAWIVGDEGAARLVNEAYFYEMTRNDEATEELNIGT